MVGFNNVRFDDRVLYHANWPLTYPPAPRYDILAELWRAKGMDPDNFSDAHKGHGLDACARANGLPGKNGNGAVAPILWQYGKIGTVIDYCLDDVRLTERLFHTIVKVGGLIDPVDGKTFVAMRSPRVVADTVWSLDRKLGHYVEVGS
jgi:hypothetical protein